jgi:transposase
MSQQEELIERKRRAMGLMEAGASWKEANEQCRLSYTRRGIQQLYHRWQEKGDEALIDHRHGHPYKATQKVREWLKERCEQEEEIRSPQLASEIEAEFSVKLDPQYVTFLRHQLGLPVAPTGRPRQHLSSEQTPETESEADFSPR